MKRTTTLGLLVLLIGMCLTTGASAAVYKSYVDQDYGFYRITPMDQNQTTSYDKNNRTLIINVSDSIVWVNDATPDVPLTIISEQGLWNNTVARLRWNYQKFNYTFNESGTYSFYIKEYPKEQHQTIIVDPIETPTPELTSIMTIGETPTIAQTINETPIVTSTEIPIKTSKESSDNIVIIFEIIVIVIAVLLTSYFRKKA